MSISPVANTQAVTLMPHQLSYKKRNSGRGFHWLPQGTEWQTEASSYLVSHDVYHHTPNDTGSFPEEVATFGAEWYVNIEALKAGQRPDAEDAKGQERACMDVLEGMLIESKAPETFALPEVSYQALPGVADAHMLALGDFAADTLIQAKVLDKSGKAAFAESFRQYCRRGYWAARARFPDQKLVRAEFLSLVNRLNDLVDDEDTLPEEHVLTIVREGARAELVYAADADAELKLDADIVEVLAMPWYENQGRMALAGISIHQDELGFVELTERYFDGCLREGDTVPADVVPQDTSARLKKAYVRGLGLKATIEAGGMVWLTVDQAQPVDYSPRGRPIYCQPRSH